MKAMPQDSATGFFEQFKWLDDNPVWANVIEVGALLVLGVIILGVTRILLLPALRRLVKKTRTTWDDAFVDASFFRWLSMMVPAYVIQLAVGATPHLNETVLATVLNVASSFMAFSAMMAVGAFLSAASDLYSQRTDADSRPIKGYVQIAKIFVYVLGGVSTIALLAGQDPSSFIAGIGAFTAILLLIFKDTILSLVASIQLTSNDMVRIGDWIEMPSAKADGDVIDIALHTVKIQNWDKTISTVPTHKLISDSFKNWRGMQASGGRRIKRNLHIDMSTVGFLAAEDIERFSKFDLLKDYISKKQSELAQRPPDPDSNPDVTANSRRLTNIGTFRAYVIRYLRSNPLIHKDMTFLVRQLQPTEYGLPIEIYIFTTTTAWVDYENIQADIFDHFLAILPEFGLRVFQRPAGNDLRTVAGHS